MSVRLTDTAILLEPATSTNDMTDEPVIDWDEEPTSATTVRFKGIPLSSDEAVLTEETIVERWKGWLGPELDGVVDPTMRVRWDGDDYEIDGAIRRHKSGQSVRFLSIFLKRVS